MTKTNGYYWCDTCDESAYGRACPTCRKPARFIAARADRRVNRERLAALATEFFALKHTLTQNTEMKGN